LIATELPEWTLQIIGDGSQMGELVKMADCLGIRKQVDFVGETSEPYAYLEKAQCFVLASLFEGFPMSSLEALAHGLPVVGYRVCNGINIQIVDGENGVLVDECSSKGTLARALFNVLSDADMRLRMGAASFERYNTLFSNKVIYDKWESLFIEAVEIYRRHEHPSLSVLLTADLHDFVFGGVRN
jgi:glycosyltransferase involved in cell wall biosynthesis